MPGSLNHDCRPVGDDDLRIKRWHCGAQAAETRTPGSGEIVVEYIIMPCNVHEAAFDVLAARRKESVPERTSRPSYSEFNVLGKILCARPTVLALVWRLSHTSAPILPQNLSQQKPWTIRDVVRYHVDFVL